MKTTEDNAFYVIYLLDDDITNTMNVISSLMLFLFDFQHVMRIVNTAHTFGRDEILITDNSNDIKLVEKILKDFKVRVLVEKHKDG